MDIIQLFMKNQVFSDLEKSETFLKIYNLKKNLNTDLELSLCINTADSQLLVGYSTIFAHFKVFPVKRDSNNLQCVTLCWITMC